jgi:hypothetical protein
MAKKKSKKVETPPPSAIVRQEPLTIAEAIEKVLIAGDLSPLTPEQRVEYYKKVCLSLGLNPLVSPFQYILFREPGGGAPKLSLYATKSATEQLRKIHGVSVIPPFRRVRQGDIITVEVDVRDKWGRTDTASGSVPTFRFKDGSRIDFTGTELCNADMKAETKAKRRATLSICGLAFLDESELDTMNVVGGVTPDGRIYQYRNTEPQEMPALDEHAAHGHQQGSEKAKMAEEQLRKVEEEDRKLLEARKAKKVGSFTPDLDRPSDIPKAAQSEPVKALDPNAKRVEIDWSDPKSPIVRGDIADLLPLMQKHCTLVWHKDWWHCTPENTKVIGEMCAELGFRLEETGLEQSSPGAMPGGTAADRTEGKSRPKANRPPAAAPTLLSGIIEQANMVSGAKPRMDVLLKIDKTKHVMTSWGQSHWPWLTKGKGQAAELYVEKRTKDDKTYTNIVGLKRCAGTTFDTDGKTPCIDVNREAGSPTLFGGVK